MSRRFFRFDQLFIMAIACLASLCLPADSFASPNRFALIIGNSNYISADVIPNPKNDAQAMADKLKGLEFDVTLGVDLDHNAFVQKIDEFNKKVEGSGSGQNTILFFYAGHAVQLAGENHLMPIDVEPQSESELVDSAIPLRLLMNSLDQNAKTRLIFLDSCRDNPFSKTLANVQLASNGKDKKSRSINRGLRKVGSGLASVSAEGGSGTFIAFATKPGSVALDGHSDHSPFTTALLKNIERQNLEIDALMRDVRYQVIELTKLERPEDPQIPWQHSSLLEPFYFNLRENNDDLVLSVQMYLTRASCYSGKIDGNWGSGSQKSLNDFKKLVGLAVDENQATPTIDDLKMLKTFSDKTCQVATPARQTASFAGTRSSRPATRQKSTAKKRPSAPGPVGVGVGLGGAGIF